MNQRGIVPIVIIISVVVLCFVVGGVYYLGLKSGTSTVTYNTNQTLEKKINPSPSATPLVTQLPSVASTLSPSDENSGKKQYTNSTYNYSLEYPNTWSLSRNTDREGVPQVVIRTDNSSSTALHIAVNSPYSTSGAICADQDCTPTSKIMGIINGQAFSADVVTVNGENRFTLEIPNKKALVQGYSESVPLNIYISYKNDAEKTAILSILSSIKY